MGKKRKNRTDLNHFLEELQMTEADLKNCLSEICIYNNYFSQIYKRANFNLEAININIIKQAVRLYNDSQVNIRTGKIVRASSGYSREIPKDISNVNIGMIFQEKDQYKRAADIDLFALLLSNNNLDSVVGYHNNKEQGVKLRGDTLEPTDYDDLIMINLNNVKKEITSILICAYAFHADYICDNFSLFKFEISSDNEKSFLYDIDSTKDIYNAKGLIVLEIMKQKKGWVIGNINQPVSNTICDLVDIYKN